MPLAQLLPESLFMTPTAGEVTMEGQTEHSTGRNRSMEEGVGELVDEAARAMGDVKEEVKERTERWTHSAGQRGESLARALEAASRTLRDEGEGGMADLAERAARQLERMGGYLERGEPGSMMDDLEEAGRSNPTMFLGAAFAAGVLGGRLLRASAHHDRGTSNGASRAARDTGSGEGAEASHPPTPTMSGGETIAGRDAGDGYPSISHPRAEGA
jgi:hypothetical protein